MRQAPRRARERGTTALLWWQRTPWRKPGLTLFFALLSAAALAFAPAISDLPQSEAGRTVAAVFVAAQATIAALGVAVMVFVLQTMTLAEIEHERVRDEYERQIAASPNLFALLALISRSFLLMWRFAWLRTSVATTMRRTSGARRQMSPLQAFA